MAETISLEEAKKLIQFKNAFVAPLIEALRQNKSEFKLIQDRYDTVAELSRQKYGKMFDLRYLGVKVAPKGQSYLIPFGFGANNTGVLEIVALLPALFEVHLDCQKSYPENGSLVFKTEVIIGFMHEAEHAAYNLFPVPQTLTSDMKIQHECVAWAKTCEYTIKPLVEIYHLPLSASDQECYDAWLQCGQDGHSERWRAIVRKVYADEYASENKHTPQPSPFSIVPVNRQ